TLNARQKWPLNSRWQLQLRESVGQGYRVPNLKDRYYVFDHSVNGYMVLGNPDLTPEHSYSGQFSATLTDQQSWNLELSAFVNRLYDLIEAEHSGEFEDNGRVAIYRYSNVEDARTAGAEIALQYSHPRVTLRASYGYLNAVDLGTDLPLLNRAPHHAKGMVTTFLTPAWDATLTWDWQNGMATNTSNENDIRYSRALARLDLKTGYQVRPDLLLFAGINNLTDNVRDPADAYDRRPSEGRFPYLGLDLNF
ncbi:MAG: TonB-dependent receptor, partial [Pseudomonadota bacterium]|nr:TonB-dependent receptor [Pseudomonadota bacterium]